MREFAVSVTFDNKTARVVYAPEDTYESAKKMLDDFCIILADKEDYFGIENTIYRKDTVRKIAVSCVTGEKMLRYDYDEVTK